MKLESYRVASLARQKVNAGELAKDIDPSLLYALSLSVSLERILSHTHLPGETK